MKTLKSYQIALSTLGFTATASLVTADPGNVAPSPAELTATRCLICHGNPEAGNPRLAPPFMMMKMHYQSLDEKAFIKAVSSWVKKPDPQKSRMPGAINRFGLMPALPYPDAEVTAIAKYLFETQFSMPGPGNKQPGQGQGGMSCGSGETAATKADEGSKECGPGCGKGCGPGNCSAPRSAAKPSDKGPTPKP